MKEIEKLTEELLTEFSLFKRSPKIINDEFLSRLKSEKIKSKQVTLKNCKTAGIYKCDINIDKLSKYVKDIMSINSKYEKELVKLFKTKYTLDDIMENTAKSKDIKEDVSKIFEYDKLIKLLDSKMSSLSEIHKNSKNIIPYKKGINNISISTNNIIKITEDYIKLREITESDKFDKLKKYIAQYNKEHNLLESIKSIYGKEYTEKYDDDELFEHTLTELTSSGFSLFNFNLSKVIKTVELYRDALSDIIRRLYKEC